MSPRMVLALALVALTPAPAGASDDVPTAYLWRPLAAIAVDADAAAVLSWAPGPVAADAYEIYGINETGAVAYLTTVPGAQTFADVAPGYSTYGITAIRTGVKAPMVQAFNPECIVIVTGPPPDAYIDECQLAAG